MRIAQVAPLWTMVPPKTYGGVEAVIAVLCEELVRQGHQVTLFASGDSSFFPTRPVYESHLLEAMADGRASSYQPYINALIADALRAAHDFDLLHFHVEPEFIPLAAMADTPVLFTLHTLLSGDDWWAINRYPHVKVAGISRCQLAAAERPLPVVYNGCDFDAFTPKFSPGSYLAFLGRMGPQKNPLEAIRIAQHAGMPIVLGGQPQTEAEEHYFRREIVPLIDGKMVRYLGAVDHARKNELLRGASALLFPVTWAEPFGLVMIEAMACGTPVVGHGVGAVNEVIDNGITGWRARSIPEMRALLEPALRLDRCQVREHACKRFGHVQMVEAYLRIYNKLVCGSGNYAHASARG